MIDLYITKFSANYVDSDEIVKIPNIYLNNIYYDNDDHVIRLLYKYIDNGVEIDDDDSFVWVNNGDNVNEPYIEEGLAINGKLYKLGKHTYDEYVNLIQSEIYNELIEQALGNI